MEKRGWVGNVLYDSWKSTLSKIKYQCDNHINCAVQIYVLDPILLLQYINNNRFFFLSRPLENLVNRKLLISMSIPVNDFVGSLSYMVYLAAPGAVSRALINNDVFKVLLYTVIRKPPPTPVKSGHTTLSHNNVPIAASTEFPPFFKMSLTVKWNIPIGNIV